MSDALLDNIFWHSLNGSHAGLAAGTPTARRYVRGYSPLLGFADPAHPDLAAIATHCAPGEQLYCSGWTGPLPAEWTVALEAPGELMVWGGSPPPPNDELVTVRLGPEHVPQMRALVALTNPGPFGERTVEMGEFHGLFEGDRLIAMAGERLYAHPWREVSGICTDPAFQGRGLARRLTNRVIRAQLARGQRPFLHVMQGNVAARSVYRGMGFAVARVVPLRALVRAG